MKENLNWGLFSKYRTELYGAATIMIMIFHCQNIFSTPGIIYNTIIKNLNYGVDMFLFLSGICLYFSFSKDNNYRSFMKKRCERTLVPYMVIGFFYWAWKFLIAEFSILDFIYNISGLSLILRKEGSYLVFGKATMWYVAFIMLMYALYPFIYKSLFSVDSKKRTYNFSAMMIFSVAITLFIKGYAFDSYDSAEVFLTRIPVFLIGCYFGKTVKEKKKFNIRDYILFFTFIPLKLITSIFINSDDRIFHRYLGLFGSILICFLIVFVLEVVSNIKFITTPAKKVLTFFGNLSLEIYMTHVMLYTVVLFYIPDIKTSDAVAYWQKILIYTGILVLSVILSVIFSKTYNAIIKKYKSNKVRG